MSQCLNCGRAVEQTVGKRKKEFCGDSCRTTYWKKKNPKVQEDWEKACLKIINDNKEEMKKAMEYVRDYNLGIVHITKDGLKAINPQSKEGQYIATEVKKEKPEEEKLPPADTTEIANKFNQFFK